MSATAASAIMAASSLLTQAAALKGFDCKYIQNKASIIVSCSKTTTETKEGHPKVVKVTEKVTVTKRTLDDKGNVISVQKIQEGEDNGSVPK